MDLAPISAIVGRHNLETDDGFHEAMKEIRMIEEVRLRYCVFSPVAGAKDVRMRALSQCELERRAAKAQRRLTYVSAGVGFIGVLVGAILTVMLSEVFDGSWRPFGRSVDCPTVTNCRPFGEAGSVPYAD